MSQTAAKPRRPPAPPERSSNRPLPIAAVAAVLIGVGAVVLALAGSGDPSGPTTAGTGPMGGRLVDVDMGRSGTVVAGPVEVVGSTVRMGDVPLDVTVVPSWTLVNTGSEPVTLGEPHASVLEGCCPGPLLIGSRILGPGERTELSFPLQMHPGMDGPHRFAVHVPVGDGDDLLELHAIGDFHD